MSDELEERQDRMWKMEEVREGDTEIDDPPDTDNTPDTTDAGDTSGDPDAPDTQDAQDTPGTPGTPDVEDTPDTVGMPDAADASIRDLFLAAEAQDLTVDDLRNVNVYLFEQVHGEMRDLLAEVNYRAMKQRGEEVQMNKEFFNAIYRVAARHEEEVLDELDLDA